MSSRPSSIVKRLAVLGALGTTLGIAAPEAGASAAGTPGFPETGFPIVAPDVSFLPDNAAVSGQVISGPAVVGTIVLTAAPIWVVNANNQNTMGVNVAGVQVAALP